MDHQQQQQPKMSTQAPTPAPVQPSTPIKPASELSAIEEFVIGCLSGVSGAFCAWFHLSGLEFIFYVIFIPCLVLDIWESYVLFQAIIHSNEATYAATRVKALARKRLARQLFGQGVIMANAGLEATQQMQPFNDTHSATLRVTLYALAWLGWILVCHVLNSVPAKDLVSQELQKQRLARRNKTKLRRTRSGSSCGSHSSRRSTGSSSRSSRTSRTSVPIDLA